MLMKRKIMAIATSLLTIGLIFGAYHTSAYYTAEERAHNVITSGDIDIDLVEMMESEDGSIVPFENQEGVMPGVAVSKIVTVKNIGGQPAFIRIRLDQLITLADGTESDIDSSLVSCNLNTENWTEKDGYYYYNDILNPSEETEPLFTEVTLSGKMGNIYQSSKFELIVYAQATQVANNGENALDALGWPAESTQ